MSSPVDGDRERVWRRLEAPPARTSQAVTHTRSSNDVAPGALDVAEQAPAPSPFLVALSRAPGDGARWDDLDEAHARAALDALLVEGGADAADAFVDGVAARLAADEAELARDQSMASAPRGDLPGVRASPSELAARARDLEARRTALAALRTVRADWRRENAAFVDDVTRTARAVAHAALEASARGVESEAARYGVRCTPETHAHGDHEAVELHFHMDGGAEGADLARDAAHLVDARARWEAKAEAARDAMATEYRVEGPGVVPRRVPTAESRRLEGEARSLARAYVEARAEREAAHPILAAFADDLGAMRVLAAGPSDDAAKLLSSAIAARRTAIADVRAALDRDPELALGFEPVLAATLDRIGASDGSPEARLVHDRAEELRQRADFVRGAVNVLAAGLGAISIFSGGLGGAVAMSLDAGLSAALALDHLARFRLERAALATDFDRAKALSADEPSLFWLAADLVGAGLDVYSAARTFRALAPLARAAVTDGGREAVRALGEAAEELHPGLGSAVEESAEALRTGGRAAVDEVGWSRHFGQTKSAAEIRHLAEAERLALLARRDLGAVQASLRRGGLEVDLERLAQVKRYNFDSAGIVFAKDNFDAWARLAQGRGTVADVLYVRHELAEVAELEKIAAETGLDYLGRGVEEHAMKAWRRQFAGAYLQAHGRALEVEYDALASEVARATSQRVRISRAQAAVADASSIGGRNEGLKQLKVDGVRLSEHVELERWRERSRAAPEVGSRAKERLGFLPGQRPTLAEIVERVKHQSLSSTKSSRVPAGHPPPWVAPGAQGEEL